MLDTLIETIQTAVKKGDVVQLVGFGTFKSAKRAARTGKNPATGAALKIPRRPFRSLWQVPSSRLLSTPRLQSAKRVSKSTWGLLRVATPGGIGASSDLHSTHRRRCHRS